MTKAEYNQKWWKENRETAREYQRQWRLNNPELAKVKDRERRKKYADRIRAYNLEYTRKKKEWARAQCKKWRDANPEGAQEGQVRRRLREMSQTTNGRLTKGLTATLMVKQDYKCAICSGDLRLLGKHRDHKIPISKGGAHADENIQLTCPECNLRKGNRSEIIPSVFFSSASDMWYTPQDFYDKLNAEFHFDTDVCAIAENAKCAKFFTPEMDGLVQEWTGICWMNPPYGRTIRYWIKKAYESSLAGATVVCLVPARTDTQWWVNYAAKGEVRFVTGRLKFGGSENAAPFPSAVIIFRKEKGPEVSPEASSLLR